MADFQTGAFRRIGLPDRAVLAPLLQASSEQSCEFSFANLYLWGFTFGTLWQLYRGHAYFLMPGLDELYTTAPAGDEPDLAELAEVSAAVRAAGLGTGTFYHVREERVRALLPELETRFIPEQQNEALGEYLYETEALAGLHGAKLAKKRNLILQFLRDSPEPPVVRELTGENLPDALQIAREWRAGHEAPDSPDLVREADAIAHLADGVDAIGIEGLVAYVAGRPVAFCMYDRISAGIFTEPFEKGLHAYKGAPKFINHEMAVRLAARCPLLNREQDLGQEGLRHAKLSYAPKTVLRNWRLIPRLA